MRVVVVDAHPSERERIENLLSRSREFRVVGLCPDARSAFLMADTLAPDIFLVDPMLRAGGYAVIQILRVCLPRCSVVALADPSSNLAVLRAFHQGAQAFVLKTDPSECLLEALRAASRGSCYISDASLVELRRESPLDTGTDAESDVEPVDPGSATVH
jgi:DNA-binding NarL/FixJ family response regulator